jgi:transcription antitermination factor NusG
MNKNWIIATYKLNKLRILERNLLNQKFDYYLPKIITKKVNSSPVEEVLFPGYVFVNTNFENYRSLKYTIGIKDIVKFGDNISCVSDGEIKAMKVIEENSKIIPIASQLKIGQIIFIKEGSLKGNIAKVCSLPSKERIAVFLSFLGSLRRVNIPEKSISHY